MRCTTPDQFSPELSFPCTGGVLDLRLTLGTSGQPDPPPPNGISIASAIFPERTRVTNGPTDRQTDRTDTELDLYQEVAKPAFHDTDIDTDTDILARIVADTSDTCDFLKLFLCQAERGSRPTPGHPREDVGFGFGFGVGVVVGVVEYGLVKLLHNDTA